MDYPIVTLTAVMEPVILTGGGREYEGLLFGFDRRGRPVWKAIRAGKLVRIDRDAAPETWRPFDGVTWAGPLPEPVREPRPPALFTDMPSAPEPLVPADGWPFPGLPLGTFREKPRSPLELEARVLRGLRTERTPGIVKPDRLGYPSPWPATVTEWSDLIAQQENHDNLVLRALRSAWTPDRRDLGDWDVATGWLAGLRQPRQRPHKPNRWQRIFIARSLDPPWSWRRIADNAGRDVETIRGWYDEAIVRMWEKL